MSQPSGEARNSLFTVRAGLMGALAAVLGSLSALLATLHRRERA